MDPRPDLPALEKARIDFRRAEVVGWGGLLLLLAPLDLMIGFGYVTYHRYGGDNPLVVAAVVGILPEGVETMARPTAASSARQRTLRLATKRGPFLFPLYHGEYPDEARSGARFAASLWQHLRRRGLADGLRLPPVVESFWDEVPDELPAVLTWSDPSPPRWSGQHTLLSAIALSLPAAILAFVLFADQPAPYGFAVWAGGTWAVIFGSLFASLRWDWLRTARRCALEDQDLEAETGRGIIRIPWSEVTDAHWHTSSWNGKPGLFIAGAGSGAEVSVPYREGDEASGRLILWLIRALRTAGEPRAVSVPQPLRIGPGSDPARTRSWMARPR